MKSPEKLLVDKTVVQVLREKIVEDKQSKYEFVRDKASGIELALDALDLPGMVVPAEAERKESGTS